MFAANIIFSEHSKVRLVTIAVAANTRECGHRNPHHVREQPPKNLRLLKAYQEYIKRGAGNMMENILLAWAQDCEVKSQMREPLIKLACLEEQGFNDGSRSFTGGTHRIAGCASRLLPIGLLRWRS